MTEPILDEELFELEDHIQEISTKDTFKYVFSKPTFVFRSVNKYGLKKSYYVFAFIIILFPSILNSFNYYLVSRDPLIPSYYSVYFFTGFLGALIGYFALSLAVWVSGFALSGKGTYKKLFNNLLVAGFPYAVFLAFQSIWTLVSPMFSAPKDAAGLTNVVVEAPAIFSQSLVPLAVSILGLVLMVKAIAVVQDFSRNKAVVNIILGILLIAIPFGSLFALNYLGR